MSGSVCTHDCSQGFDISCFVSPSVQRSVNAQKPQMSWVQCGELCERSVEWNACKVAARTSALRYAQGI